MATTKEDRSFKILINKRVTSSGKAFYEEIGDETLIVTNEQIWAENVETNNPTAAIAAGVAEFRSKLVLTEDVTVGSQQSWFADDSGRLKDWISDRFGSSYTTKLFDNNNNEIFPTDSLNWFFDYPTGLLTISGNAAAFTQPFKIDGYRYVGQKGITDAAADGYENYIIVDSIVERDLIPAAALAEGILVHSKASGIVWKLESDLSTWTPIDNIGFGHNELPPGIGSASLITLKVRDGYSDAIAEGTDAAPFGSIQGAIRAVPRGGLGSFVIDVGPGAFESGDIRLFGSFPEFAGRPTIKGSTTTVATVSLSSSVLISGKYAQRRLTVSDYSADLPGGPVLGEHWIEVIFPGFGNFYTPCLSGDGYTMIDIAGTTPFAASFDIVTLDTELFSTASQVRITGNATAPISLEGLRMTGGTSGIEVLRHVDFNGVHIPSTEIIMQGSTQIAGTVHESGELEIQDLRSNNIINDSYLTRLKLETPNGLTLVRSVIQSSGTGIFLGIRNSDSFGSTRSSVNLNAIDFEDCSLAIDSLRSSFVFQNGDISCDSVADFMRLQEGSFYRILSGRFLTGAISGDGIEIREGSQTKGVAAGASSLIVAGDDVIVGANGPFTFDDLPKTDFALGDSSEGVIAK